MAQPTSPFAGVKLSEQARPAAAGLDQRLFSSSAPQPVPPSPVTSTEDTRPKEARNQPRNLPTKEPSNLGTLEPRKPAWGATSEPAPTFDINEPAYQNNTFAFTAEELIAIEDLKLELRRRMDLRATKNDIVRCGVHTLVEDYRRHGERSIIVTRLKGKRLR